MSADIAACAVVDPGSTGATIYSVLEIPGCAPAAAIRTAGCRCRCLEDEIGVIPCSSVVGGFVHARDFQPEDKGLALRRCRCKDNGVTPLSGSWQAPLAVEDGARCRTTCAAGNEGTPRRSCSPGTTESVVLGDMVTVPSYIVVEYCCFVLAVDVGCVLLDQQLHARKGCMLYEVSMFQSKFGGSASGPQKNRRVRPIKPLSLFSGRKNHIFIADYLSMSLSVLQLFSLTFVLRCFTHDTNSSCRPRDFLGQQVFKGAQRPRPEEGHRVICRIHVCMCDIQYS